MAKKRGEYDGAYKYVFSNKRIFLELLTQFIEEEFAKNIDPDDIELVDRSFVSDEFKKRESDIIYRVKTEKGDAYIYVLVEFQSDVDKTIPVRMLLYILQFYDQIYRNSTKGKLPAVFPVLLYNRRAKWTVPTNIRDLIEGSIPEKYIPSFCYYPIIERDYSDEFLENVKGIVASIIYLEKQEDAKAFQAAIGKLTELIREQQPEQLRL